VSLVVHQAFSRMAGAHVVLSGGYQLHQAADVSMPLGLPKEGNHAAAYLVEGAMNVKASCDASGCACMDGLWDQRCNSHSPPKQHIKLAKVPARPFCDAPT
jgi:hypothetical protein